MEQQFTVPQFIDAEDKIVGPISVRQFVIMLVGAGLIFVIYQITDFSLLIISAIMIGGVAAIVAFAKVNGQPFHMFLLHITQTVKDPSLRVWRRDISSAEISLQHQREAELLKAAAAPPEFTPHEKPPVRKLAELSLIVDTGGAYHGQTVQEEVEL